MSSAATTLAALHGGRVLLSDNTWDDSPLYVDGSLIAETAPCGKWLDASGCVVLPGIIDFHGDAFERQIMPRPGVRFPVDLALFDTDRQLASNGITTAMHGITYSWEGGLRGHETATQLLRALDCAQSRFLVDHRVHLRFECHNVDGVGDALDWLNSGRVGVLAFNEHLPGMRRKTKKLQEYADRAGSDVAHFAARMDEVAARAAEVPAVIERLAAAARSRGVPMASHDDHSIDVRDGFQRLGCYISEFPLTRDVASHANAQGAAVVCGAPNVLRGGSHVGAPSAAELAAEGLCSILASDYYYPAPLHAAFELAHRGVMPLAAAWSLVSRNPATALGMSDRGSLAQGMRADMLMVDARDPAAPRLVATICAGRIAYLSDGERLHG